MNGFDFLSAMDADFLGRLLYVGAIGLLTLGLYAMVSSRHVVRIILGLLLVEAGVNLFLVATGFRPDAAAPILTGGIANGAMVEMVDPIPQALTLTAIVIGVGVLALALALVVRVKQAYGTLDTHEIARHVARETGDAVLDLEDAAADEPQALTVRGAKDVR